MEMSEKPKPKNLSVEEGEKERELEELRAEIASLRAAAAKGKPTYYGPEDWINDERKLEELQGVDFKTSKVYAEISKIQDKYACPLCHSPVMMHSPRKCPACGGDLTKEESN